MATTTTVSAWGKPGAWALDSEAHEEELVHQDNTTTTTTNSNGHYDHHNTTTNTTNSDFPSLSAAAAAAAAATTKSKKKKPLVLSLSEFATGKSVTHGSAKSAHQSTAPKGLTPDELLILPTGPRERSADELDRFSSRLGGGFRSYGSIDNGGGGRSSGRYYSSNGGGDSSNGRWGSSSSSPRVSEDSRRNLGFNNNRESAPSRADEIDDWGAAKKSVAAAAPGGYERRERSNGGGGFFESNSRADESDSWLTKKSFVPSEPRRLGFENNRDRRGGFEGFQKEGFDGGEADSETWLKKKEEGIGSGSGGGRPRLVLQPRTLPVSNDGSEQQLGLSSATPVAAKSKGSNPFGAARPREEVLAEKGQDWKKIDEQLESVKIKESGGGSGDGASSHWKKSFGSGNGRATLPEGRAERSWRKPESADAAPPQSEETAVNKDEGMVEGVVEN